MSYDQTELARSIARQMSYNNGDVEAKAKFLLLEMASTIDANNVTAHKKRDGLMLCNGFGEVRYATLKERLIYKIFGILPKRVYRYKS